MIDLYMCYAHESCICMSHIYESFICICHIFESFIFSETRIILPAATLCNVLECTASHCNTLQHTATHCNTLQHTATHCNTCLLESRVMSNIILRRFIGYSRGFMGETRIIFPQNIHFTNGIRPYECISCMNPRTNPRGSSSIRVATICRRTNGQKKPDLVSKARERERECVCRRCDSFIYMLY